MIISAHGGLCCGIQHIHVLGMSPKDFLPAKKADEHYTNKERKSLQKDSVPCKQTENLYCSEAPKETYEERFIRFVSFIKETRRNSMTEVVLVDNPGSWIDQVRLWEPILEDQGFKLVTTFTNGNTGRDINVYHLVLKDGEPV